MALLPLVKAQNEINRIDEKYYAVTVADPINQDIERDKGFYLDKDNQKQALKEIIEFVKHEKMEIGFSGEETVIEVMESNFITFDDMDEEEMVAQREVKKAIKRLEKFILKWEKVLDEIK